MSMSYKVPVSVWNKVFKIAQLVMTAASDQQLMPVHACMVGWTEVKQPTGSTPVCLGACLL
jgi:hypothetical protein